MTLLHLGCYPGINKEVFTYLVEECRGSIWKTDVHGDLPIHVAASNNHLPKFVQVDRAYVLSKKKKIKMLLKAARTEGRNMEMIAERNTMGETLLHILCNFPETEAEIPAPVLRWGPDL